MKTKSKKTPRPLTPIRKKLSRYDERIAAHVTAKDRIEQRIFKLREQIAEHNKSIESIGEDRAGFITAQCFSHHKRHGFATPSRMMLALEMPSADELADSVG